MMMVLSGLPMMAADRVDPVIALARHHLEDDIGAGRLVDALLTSTTLNRRTFEQQFLAALVDAEVTDAGYQAVCQRLARVASVASIPAMELSLSHQVRCHGACLVLLAIPGPEATAALGRALAKVTGPARQEIMSCLGRRGDAEAVAWLAPLIGIGDATVTETAIRALGMIGTNDAVVALRTVAPSVASDEALLMAALRLKTCGDQTMALATLRVLADPKRNSQVRGEALAALSQNDGEVMIPQLIDALASGRPEVMAGVTRALIAMPGSAATRMLVERINQVAPDIQVAICGILAQRRDPDGAEVVADRLHSPDPAVRRAALVALGDFGGDRHVDAMLALGSEAAFSKAVREALVRMRPRSAIDQALLQRLERADQDHRVADAKFLVVVLTERQCRALVPFLFKALDGGDAESTRQAFTSFAKLGTTEDIPALLDRFVARQGDRDLGDLIAVLLRRVVDPAPLSELIESRWRDASVPVKCGLLRLLAVIGRGRALMCEALVDPSLAAAAVLALGQWPHADLASELTDLLATTSDGALRSQGLRILADMLNRPDRPAHGQCAQWLMRALGTAPVTDDQRLVLAALAQHPDEQTVLLAGEFLHDEDVRLEAENCLLQLAKTMESTHSANLRAVLMILKDSEHQTVRTEADRLLAAWPSR